MAPVPEEEKKKDPPPSGLAITGMVSSSPFQIIAVLFPPKVPVLYYRERFFAT